LKPSAPAPEEIARRIQNITQQWPWLVLEDDEVVAGYAYASRHRERAAYGWAVDTAVYVSHRFQRHGVGRALYTTLFSLLRKQGFFKACAGITLPNTASIGLHEAMGFKLVGVYPASASSSVAGTMLRGMRLNFSRKHRIRRCRNR
jgi:phosphinothricin acetyltransferase